MPFSPTFAYRKHVPAPERFAAFVNKSGPIPAHRPELGECWTWTGALNRPNGYGLFGAENWRKPVYTHRYAWRLAHGDAGKMQVLHKCDNRRCVRPDHLFLGTHADNMRDMAEKGRATGKDMRGTKNPRAILTENDVPEVRRLYATGEFTQLEIAQRFGVSRSAVCCLLRGASWKNV